MNPTIRDSIRDAGYEALFFLGGYLALAIEPTPRNWAKIEKWLHESMGRRKMLHSLRERGLVEDADAKVGGILRLTKAGRSLFAGGRDPAAEWNRDWDGQWRILVFDLPQNAGRIRSHFWRWLRHHHFGKFQGSVWGTPHPIPAIEEILRDSDLQPNSLMEITGDLTGGGSPQEIAAKAWDFHAINSRFRSYENFARRVGRQVRKKPPASARFRDILREDRKLWWSAVRIDPLLPKVLLPSGYQGTAAWKARQALHLVLSKAH